MSYAGFCDVCNVPYYEMDALRHQHVQTSASQSADAKKQLMGELQKEIRKLQPQSTVESAPVKCGLTVAAISPRMGMYIPCALDIGHKGDCVGAGNCVKHGPYLGKPHAIPQCPKWPDCIPGCTPAEGPRKGTRFEEFDDAEHPANKWWEDHGQFMMSGGGRAQFIWACRGWIAHEQFIEGAEVTGESVRERKPEPAVPSTDERLGKELHKFVLDAVDDCNPSSDGERFCLYNVIETAAKRYSERANVGLLTQLEEARRREVEWEQGHGRLTKCLATAQKAGEEARRERDLAESRQDASWKLFEQAKARAEQAERERDEARQRIAVLEGK